MTLKHGDVVSLKTGNGPVMVIGQNSPTTPDKMVCFWATDGFAAGGVHEVEVSLAALAPHPAYGAFWQPIETAPQDGRPVLIYGPAFDRSPGGVMAIKSYHVHDGWYGAGILEPTHWMPIPVAPE